MNSFRDAPFERLLGTSPPPSGPLLASLLLLLSLNYKGRGAEKNGSEGKDGR